MHKCIVCGNTYDDTKVNRPGVIYHGFPKDECMRRKWLKVFGIDRCFDWHRICSDHFLEENYKPRKKRFLLPNTIPQPYVRNGFLSNYAAQSNGVETGNNVILPMEQNIIKNLAYYDESDCIESEFYSEKHIGNAGVNNFKSPRLTISNEDMSNKNMPDHTLRTGVRCSIKNCFNRLSKNLSLFGYPKEFKLRKTWIEKLGIDRDPAEIVISGIRICSIHFEVDCFKNIKLKNRLKRDAVPSLYLDIAPPALPVSISEVPVSTCEDQLICPIDAEQTSDEKQNNVKDDTDNTSNDSFNSLLSVTSEPMENRTSQCDTITDTCNHVDEHGFIFEWSKEVVLPSIFWKSEHLHIENATRFCEHDANDVAEKKIYFYNNLVPTIEIYGKEYEYKTPITTKKELDDLLEKIDGIQKCYGRGGFVFEQCLGYFENSLVNMCSGCEGLVTDQHLQRMKAKIEAKNKIAQSIRNRIAEKTAIVLKLRKEMAESKRKRQLTLALNHSASSSGTSNIIKP